MKKLTLILGAFLLFGGALNAQEPLTNKKGHIILPEEGDFALGFNAIPIFSYLGNMFNGNLNNNTHLGNNKFLDGLHNFNQNTIFMKYFIADNMAVRGEFRFGVHNYTNYNEVHDDYSNSPKDLVIDTYRQKSATFTLGAGYEYRLGKGRVQGIFGGGIYYHFNSPTSRYYEYGNAFANGNAAPRGTNWNNNGGINSEGPIARRIVSSKSGKGHGLGARAFVGVEYFFAPKISIGAEFGWGLNYMTYGGGTTVYHEWDNLNSEIFVDQTTGIGDKKFDLDTDNFGGMISLTFHFQ